MKMYIKFKKPISIMTGRQKLHKKSNCIHWTTTKTKINSNTLSNLDSAGIYHLP